MIQRKYKWKKIYTITAVILLLLIYLVIFWFSSNNAENSSEISMTVSRFFVKIYDKIFGGRAALAEPALMAVNAENGIRKLAHFMEYLSVGFLSYGIVLCWYHPKWKGRWLIIIQLLLSASLDEFHQLFVPGRHASVKDILLDMAGGITGMLLIVCLKKLIIRRL